MTRLLTVTEFAEQARLPKSKVWDLIRAGRLPAIDISTSTGQRPRYRIPEDAIEHLLAASNTVQRKPEPTSPKPAPAKRRRRLDANVKKVF